MQLPSAMFNIFGDHKKYGQHNLVQVCYEQYFDRLCVYEAQTAYRYIDWDITSLLYLPKPPNQIPCGSTLHGAPGENQRLSAER